MKALSPLLILFVLIGCEASQNRTYEVTVKNTSTKPVTIWLTKSGSASVSEPQWKSPEELAAENPEKLAGQIGGAVLLPGDTASTGKLSGSFASGVDAVLRVYLGKCTMKELLARHAGHPDRADITLQPGVNEVVVTDSQNSIKATRVQR